MRDITVMLSAVGSKFAPGIIKCLKENGERKIKIIGVDMIDDPTNKYLVDKFYKVPPSINNNYTNILLEICKKENVDILMPQTSSELPYLLRDINKFEENNIKVSITKSDMLLIANNKLKLFNFMKDNDIFVSKYEEINSIFDFDRVIKKMGYPYNPVCIKLTESSGARGVRIIDSAKSRYQIFAYEKPDSLYISYEDMIKTLQEAEDFPNLLAMEFLPGDEYNVDLVANDGEIICMAGRRNPVMEMSITQESVIEYNEEAYKLARSIVKKLKLDGNIGLDFKFSKEGSCHLLEINPRIDATVSIFAAGGLNLPYIQIKNILKEDIHDINVNYGVRLKRRYLEMFTDKDGMLINW